MKIKKIEAYQVRLPLKQLFKTSYGLLREKAFDIFIITNEQGQQGIGELVPFENPDYIEETLMNSRQIIENNLLPLLVQQEIFEPQTITEIFKVVQGNYMAKSAIETAYWDLYAKENQQNLSFYLHGSRPTLPVGVSVGMQPSTEQLLAVVADYLEAGYQRVKLKIQPGYDYQPLAALRQKFPELTLMADANSAYTLQNLEQLKQLDELNLTMLEQPFNQRDFTEHAILQKEMQTAICLDENIRSLMDVKTAVALNSCRAINLKIPRVGGLQEAQRIYEFCLNEDILVWLGGMFESGVGRSLNLQFASQPGFNFPGDISASDRYFAEDIVKEPAKMIAGSLPVPKGVGLGVELDWDHLKKWSTGYQLYYKA
ncbi:o-succinylbenzoate synthase [Enterococcus sp. HY326]|uniref:o-succinylbenzoate synthase n=1 Tax=Enterococcus sp. HY326 TaxID=2971265 RepID=UPI002240A413|nr:o-succinylbenzoate synthase [Enterococcus sp. HY326]